MKHVVTLFFLVLFAHSSSAQVDYTTRPRTASAPNYALIVPEAETPQYRRCIGRHEIRYLFPRLNWTLNTPICMSPELLEKIRLRRLIDEYERQIMRRTA